MAIIKERGMQPNPHHFPLSNPSPTPLKKKKMMTSRLSLKAPISSKFRQVGLLGGKNTGKGESYKLAAAKLGEELAARGLDVICSGGATGLLGIVSHAIRRAGGQVLGISLTSLEEGDALTERRVIPDPHQRKKEIARLADCFIVLPGGFETMEEFAELTSWAQLGIHDKPVGLLNVDGFFDFFLAQIDTAVEGGFIRPSQKGIIVISTDANELLQKLEEYGPTHEGAIPRHRWEAEAGSSSAEPAEPENTGA